MSKFSPTLPKVSIVIPTYNSEEYIDACLRSISKQDYPKNKLEVLVVDGGSTDNTREIAMRYRVKIIHNPKRLAEPAKTLGFKHSTGDLFMYFDSDAEFVSKNWLKLLVTPLVKDPSISGSFTRFTPKKTQTAFGRYVSYNKLQLWSMLSYLLPSIESVTIKRNKNYDVIKIDPKRCPPIGICLYRKTLLDRIIKNPDTFNFVDIAIPIQLAEIGCDRLAYIEGAGMYHRRTNLNHELKRQKRDVTVTYLPVVGQRKFDYIDFSNMSDVLKVMVWVVYVNLLIPSILVGIYKSLKYKDIACMYELPTNLFLTNYIIYLFLSNKKGRELLLSFLK